MKARSRERCTDARPRLDHLTAIAKDYGTSLLATAIRYVEHATMAWVVQP